MANRNQGRVMIHFCHVKGCIPVAIVNDIGKPIHDRRDTHIKQVNNITLRNKRQKELFNWVTEECFLSMDAGVDGLSQQEESEKKGQYYIQ